MDDEYLRLVFASLISGNDLARKLIWPKVMRSLVKAPKKRGLFRNLRPYRIGNIQTGIFDADIDRFHKVIDAISRCLYFYVHQHAWLEEIRVFPPATAFVHLTNPNVNSAVEKIEAGTTQYIGHLPKVGSNPDIFYFQMLENEKTGIKRQVYYGGIIVNAVFNPAKINGLLP